MRLAILTWLVLLAPALPALAADADWKLLEDKDGFTLFERKVQGSDIVAMKFRGTIDAPVWKVASVMTDQARGKEWVDRLDEMKLVRRISPTEYLEYSLIQTPFILKNRDFAIHVKLDVDGKRKSFVMHTQPVVDPKIPATDAVRAEVHSTYAFHATAGGRKTAVDVEIHVDPKGSVPKWIVNLFQRKWPRQTFDGIQKQVSKPDISTNPAFAEVLAPLREGAPEVAATSEIRAAEGQEPPARIQSKLKR
jgi:hypothetical protein